MKPSRNRYYCQDCGRIKMLFTTEKQALNFIIFNASDIAQSSGYRPERCYYCDYCGGWHVTSKKEISNSKSKTEKVLKEYQKHINPKSKTELQFENIQNKINQIKNKMLTVNIEFQNKILELAFTDLNAIIPITIGEKKRYEYYKQKLDAIKANLIIRSHNNIKLIESKLLIDQPEKNTQNELRVAELLETKNKREQISVFLQELDLNKKFLEMSLNIKRNASFEIIEDSINKMKNIDNLFNEIETKLQVNFTNDEITSILGAKKAKKANFEKYWNKMKNDLD